MKETIKKLLWILSHAKPVIPHLIFIVIISSGLSLVGVYNALISKSLIDSAINANTSEVVKWLTIMISIVIARIAISPLSAYISTYASTKLMHNIQTKIYEHITYSEWMDSSKHHSVSILTRITSDISTIVGTILGTIPSIISLSVTLIASFTTLVYLAPSLALAAILISPFLLLISRAFAPILKKLYKEAQEETVKYRTFIQESLNNIMIVKTFCLEDKNLKKLGKIQNNKVRLALKNTKVSSISGVLFQICSSGAYYIIFAWGAVNISLGKVSYGTLTAMLQLYNNIQGPFSSLAGTFPSIIGAIAAAERLMELEDMTLEDETLKLTYNEDSNNINIPKIAFKDISFGYKENQQIINNINLEIEPGETIAFIGPSGEGKTTLIRLLLSLIKQNSGEITLEYEDDLISLNRSHRELMSYVPQGNTLFSGTIEENLRCGKETADFNDIKEATKLACAWDFINKLDDGFNTEIGEKGSGVSEGQAQRLAIARAFLRKRPILILDEATSSLDAETEINVLKSVKNLKHKPTCIIITHRPSALNICDRILKLEKGRLKEIERESLFEVATELN